MTSGYPAATPGRLHAKRIIAWWTPFIPQDKPSLLTHPRTRKTPRQEASPGPQIMGLTQMMNRRQAFEHEVTETTEIGLRAPLRPLR